MRKGIKYGVVLALVVMLWTARNGCPTAMAAAWDISYPCPWAVNEESAWGIGEEELAAAAAAAETTATDPRDVSDLVCYYRADTLLTEADASTPEDNEEIVSWTSLAGAYAQSGTTTKIPYYQTNEYNGKSCARFDGTDDIFTTVSQMTNQFVAGYTLIWVVGKIVDGQPSLSKYPIQAGDLVAPAHRYIGASVSSIGKFVVNLVETGTTYAVTVDTLDNGAISSFILTVVCDTTGYMTVYINGVADRATDSVSVAAANYSAIKNNVGTEAIPVLGRFADGVASTAPVAADLLIMAMYGRPLATEERIGVEAYIQAYYAIPAGRDIND